MNTMPTRLAHAICHRQGIIGAREQQHHNDGHGEHFVEHRYVEEWFCYHKCYTTIITRDAKVQLKQK